MDYFRNTDIVNEDLLSQIVVKNPLVERVYFFKETDSTNSRALDLLANGLDKNTLLFAEYQSIGKGRFTRAWDAAKGESLLFSFLLFPSHNAKHWSMLTIIASIAVVETLISFGLEAAIKWPNDVLVNGKKISGILTEVGRSEKKPHKNGVVVGIGININQVSFDNHTSFKTKPTSYKLEKKSSGKRLDILSRFLAFFTHWYEIFLNSEFSMIMEKYKVLSSTIGKNVQVHFPEKILTGSAIDVENDGGLIVRFDSGVLKKITAADVVEINWK